MFLCKSRYELWLSTLNYESVAQARHGSKFNSHFPIYKLKVDKCKILVADSYLFVYDAHDH